MSVKPPDPPESTPQPSVFTPAKTFGRRSNIKPQEPTAKTAPTVQLRKGDRRSKVSRRSPISAPYSGVERRQGHRDRRTQQGERRDAHVSKHETVKKHVETTVSSERRKKEDLSHLTKLDPVLSSPRMLQYQDFIHETITKTLDAHKLVHLEKQEASDQIMLLVKEIAKHHAFIVTPAELNHLCKVASDEMMGLGPLEALLDRAEVSEIMVNGPNSIYIEVNGVIERSSIAFRSEHQLVAICQRIVGKVGRHVDESNPMCDARLPDGSRVNIILPPLALNGTILTIRKFPPEKMTLEKMLEIGSLDSLTAELICMIAACRVNVLVSGGTGSGKTTMLNCLARYINRRERIVTCEDAAELQLQQPHVLSLETRIPNSEGFGAVSMRDLVRNSLRMRPDRIIVGEVRGAEAFDLLSAMSTGHDGSMGTVHANTPRDALARLENMIAMAGLNLPTLSVRQQIASAVNVVVHVQRIRDGSRKVTSITEITGMEGDIISMQELISYQYVGKDANDKAIGIFKASKLKPRFYEKLCEFNLEEKYIRLMEKA